MTKLEELQAMELRADTLMGLGQRIMQVASGSKDDAVRAATWLARGDTGSVEHILAKVDSIVQATTHAQKALNTLLCRAPS